MGRESRDARAIICVSLSRHNSEQDAIDDQLYEELQDRLNVYAQKLVNDPRYASLDPFIV